MYSTCINCHAALGRNEMHERFPVGRTLAIDATKGRLWVVCGACKQWNLSPIEERWEAIEDGERLYRDAKLRASTDNIGIARLHDGSELIRVGKALRPEFAAWRYGDRFRKRYIINAPGAAVVGAAGFATKGIGSWVMFQSIGLPILGLAAILGTRNLVRHLRRIVPLDLPNGERVKLTMAQVETTRLLIDPTTPQGWQLRFRHTPTAHQRRHGISKPEVIVQGAEALRYAMRLLPRINRVGGLKRTVEEAVGFMERAGSPDAVFRLASRVDPSSSKTQRGALPDEISSEGDNHDLKSPFVRAEPYIRLAVEMAAHDEQERAVLAGELSELERQWKEADEIAGIADSLTLPSTVVAQLERFRLR